MDRENIILDLAEWIEANICSGINLDDVAAKSGYSKWHLQRMFRSVAGCCLAEYIRGRRLSKAAFELKTTEATILDIALKYHFGSQQTFTRAFKRLFQKTPANYRRMVDFDHSMLPPPLHRSIFFRGKAITIASH